MEIKGPEYYAAWRAQQAKNRNAPPPPVSDRGSQTREHTPVSDIQRDIATAQEELRQMQGKLYGYTAQLSSPYKAGYDSNSEQLTSAGILSEERRIRDQMAKIANLKSQIPSNTRNV